MDDKTDFGWINFSLNEWAMHQLGIYENMYDEEYFDLKPDIPDNFKVVWEQCSIHQRTVGEILQQCMPGYNTILSNTWCQEFSHSHGFSSRKPWHVQNVRTVSAAPGLIADYFKLLQDKVFILL